MMADSLSTIETKIIRWSRGISLIGLIGLMILAVITVGEVLLRWLFKYPILGVSDVSRLVITIIAASCFPLVSAKREHITIHVLGSKLGPRANSVLEAFGAFVTLVIICLLTWQIWLYSGELATAKETTMLVRWPTSPWWRVTTLLFALCVPIQVVCVYTSLRSAFTSRDIMDLKDSHDSEEEKSG